MAKYGLGQIDLNRRAQLAILGLSNDPNRDIELLLKSGQPIEDLTRSLMADLFGGRTNGIELKLVKKKLRSVYRRLRNRLVFAKIVEELNAQKRQLGGEAAHRLIADKYGCSVKTLEAHETLLAKARAWANRRSKRSDHPPKVSERHLIIAYLYADTVGKRPSDVVKPSLPALCDFLERLDEDHADGFGFLDPPISRIRIR